jgi:Sulfatase-modifying factor enzyme 1
VTSIPRPNSLKQCRKAYFCFGPSNAPEDTYSRTKTLVLLVAVLASLLIGSSAPAGEIRIASPSAQAQVPTALEKATKEQPWQNSLGMKFVPVPGTQVLFCIWDTQVEDYSAFVDATGNDTTGGMWSLGQEGWKQLGATWKEPGFSQGPTHPVVGVSWYDATAFCAWLTTQERRSGLLPTGASYRLPTDQEWSIAVGLDSESGTTPEEKDSKVRIYP